MSKTLPLFKVTVLPDLTVTIRTSYLQLYLIGKHFQLSKQRGLEINRQTVNICLISFNKPCFVIGHLFIIIIIYNLLK